MWYNCPRLEPEVEIIARTKQLNTKVKYGNTGYYINDLGENKSPRFELYHMPTKTVKTKSDNPYDFDKYMNKIWKESDYVY